MCRHKNLKRKDFCALIVFKLINNFLFSIQANYRIQNATIDINPITQWYSDATDHQWKITLKLNFDNAYLGGIFVDSSIFGYRKKNNVPLKL